MKFIGAHVSASGGVEAAPVNASEIGANAFALFCSWDFSVWLYTTIPVAADGGEYQGV